MLIVLKNEQKENMWFNIIFLLFRCKKQKLMLTYASLQAHVDGLAATTELSNFFPCHTKIHLAMNQSQEYENATFKLLLPYNNSLEPNAP